MSYWLGLVSALMMAGGWGVQAQATGYGLRPLAFEANRGQVSAQAKLVARAPGQTVFLTPSEAVITLGGQDERHDLRLRWPGAQSAPRITGEAELPARSHFFRGSDPAKWITGIPTYARARYKKVWPGIDLVFYGNGRQLEYDIVLSPGAALDDVRFSIEGADRLEIDAGGDLVLRLGDREVRFRKPFSYQEIEGGRRPVASAYRLLPGGPGQGPQVAFEVGPHDREKTLVIDPVLVYSSYFGGSREEIARSIRVDTQGRAYLAGETTSPDFPGAGPVTHGDILLIRLAPDGEVLDTLLLGGSIAEFALDMDLDTAGFVYLTGSTNSHDFPRVNALPPQFGGGISQDAFAMKLDLDGPTILYSTRLGSGDWDLGTGIAVDSLGQAHLLGYTASADFPQVNPLALSRTAPPTLSTPDLFVAKLSASGSQLVYSTYLGGSDADYEGDIAIDPQGQAWVTGSTASADFPTAGPPSALRGPTDGFLAKLSLNGSPLLDSAYFGGSSSDFSEAVAIDHAGRIYLSGGTSSTDFPVLNALQPQIAFGIGAPEPMDIFLMKRAPGGSLIYSTYLGGSFEDATAGLAVDAAGGVYLVGGTGSSNFPLVEPIQPSCLPALGPFGRCAGDAFVTHIDPTGQSILFSTFLGGTVPGPPQIANDGAVAVAVDALGNIYVTGITRSLDFPTVHAVQSSYGGGLHDLFVAKIAPHNRPPDCASATASPALLWPPDNRLVPIAILGVTDPDEDPVTLEITAIRQDELLTHAGTPDASGLGTPVAQVRAARKGNGDGRVYRIAFEARDSLGAACEGTVTVCVPHDRRPKTRCGDGGATVDSTKP